MEGQSLNHGEEQQLHHQQQEAEEVLVLADQVEWMEWSEWRRSHNKSRRLRMGKRSRDSWIVGRRPC